MSSWSLKFKNVIYNKIKNLKVGEESKCVRWACRKLKLILGEIKT